MLIYGMNLEMVTRDGMKLNRAMHSEEVEVSPNNLLLNVSSAVNSLLVSSSE